MRASAVRLLPPSAREVVSNRANQQMYFEKISGGRSAAMRLITAPILKWGYEMNQNINYIGMVNLLRHLQNVSLVSLVSLVSREEARRIAARLRAETGADVIFFP